MCVRVELLSFCSRSLFVELNPICSFNYPGIWKTSAGKLSLQSVHLLMRSLYTVVTLCSVLQPRYVAFQQSFIPWCGFPESSSKGRKGRLFCVCKTPLPLLFMPLSALQISPSVCVTGEKDGWRGEGWGVLRNQAAENPKYLPRHPWHVVWIPPIYSCSHSHEVEVWPHLAAACLQSCMHGCVPVCIFFYQVMGHSYVTVCKQWLYFSSSTCRCNMTLLFQNPLKKEVRVAGWFSEPHD